MSNISLNHYLKDLVWQKMGQHLIDRLEKVKREGRNILLFLSGGSVVQLYGQLVKAIKNGDFKSADLAIAQVDERYKPSLKFKVQSLKLNNEINANRVRQTGLWEELREKKIPYYLVSQEGTLESSAKKYNRVLAKLFSQYDFKMTVLGIGKDGHTAGLIPSYEKMWNIKVCVVGYEISNRQNCTRVQFCQQRFKQRITITPFTLSKLDYALVGVVGEEKRQALREVLNPDNREKLDKYPAAIIQKIKKVEIFTDLHEFRAYFNIFSKRRSRIELP